MSGGATWAARVLLAVGLVMFAVWVAGRERAQSPEDVVFKWFEAAARGDLTSALRLTGGSLRRSLNMQLRDDVSARQSIGRPLDGVRGVAVQNAGSSFADQVELEVELVFEDRNERQRVRLEREGGKWLIVEFSPSDRVIPPVRYGTPAFD